MLTTGVDVTTDGAASSCSETTLDYKTSMQPKRAGLNMSSKFETAVPLHLSATQFFFRPTPYGSRQVVKQAGKPVAYLQIQ